MADIFERLVKNYGPIGQYRERAHGYFAFPKLEGEIGSRMKFRGKEVVVWSLNNYLGLANHSEVRKADAGGAKEYGLAYPMGARMMSGNSNYHEQLEEELDSSKIPENDPSKAEDFPGYPHYPAREDIMDQRNDYTREDLDVENLPNSRNATGVSQRSVAGTNNGKAGESLTPGFSLDEEEFDIREGTEADVNEDDLVVLNATNDEIGTPQNVSNEDLNTDLDVPGSELDDENELIGEEDEENNYWSLGSDRRDFNEEDPYSGPKREQE